MKKCFVLMPFSGKVNSYYKSIYKKTIEKIGYASLRADELFGPKPIISDIIEGIAESDIVLADLTNKNPNVNYELGIAHSFGKPTILVAQSLEDISFDYQHIRIGFYDTRDPDWQDRLADYITKSIKRIEENPKGYSLFRELIKNGEEDFQSNERLIDFLFEQYKRQEGRIDYEYDFHIDEFGNGKLETIFHVKAESDFSLLRFKIFNMLPGKIKILEVKEVETNRALDHFVYEEGHDYKGIYILLKTKLKGYSFGVKLVVYAENYMGDLLTKFRSFSHHTNNYNSSIKHNDKKAVYHFPVNEKFDNLTCEVTSKLSNGEELITKLKQIRKQDEIIFEFVNSRDSLPEFILDFGC